MLSRKLLYSFRSTYKNMINSKNPGFYQVVVHLSSTPEESQLARYKNRKDETITQKKARLLYQSRKRGMLENDLLLSTFADKYLKTFDAYQLDLYDRLINLPSNDWDIYYWATGVEKTPPEFQNEVMETFKKHVRNENKETRYRQPDL